MENFSFRPSFEAEKMANSFFIPTATYNDSHDQSKTPMKFENFVSPLFGAQDLSKNRYNLFEGQTFLSYPKEEEFLYDNVKGDNFVLDGHDFVPSTHPNQGFDMQYSTKLQDYAVDSYRINRSRGPSFHIGPGRKASEDFFHNGFDLLNFFSRSQDQQQRERGFSIEGLDPQLQNGFLDFRGGQMMGQGLPGNFAGQFDQHLQHGNNQGLPEDQSTQVTNQDAGNQANTHQQAEQEDDDDNDKVQKFSELEPKGKKKRKLNNNQEVPVAQVNDTTISLKLAKSKSEINKLEEEPASLSLKSSKSTVGKSSQAKAQKGKKSANNKKKGSEREQVKSEAEDKSTVPSSINVSPNLKKEDPPLPFKTQSATLMGKFGVFKKPETAQELLVGLSLPAEVEEYINNSKIFNQIKAPVIKRIGTLTVEERKVKIEKYLEKRKRRSWNKRVNYDCRKKVADNRLRIKGRFVTKDQAFVMLENLGIQFDQEKITNAEIKELLTERYGALSGKRKEGENKENGGKVEEDNSSNFGSQDEENYLKY